MSGDLDNATVAQTVPELNIKLRLYSLDPVLLNVLTPLVVPETKPKSSGISLPRANLLPFCVLYII